MAGRRNEQDLVTNRVQGNGHLGLRYPAAPPEDGEVAWRRKGSEFTFSLFACEVPEGPADGKPLQAAGWEGLCLGGRSGLGARGPFSSEAVVVVGEVTQCGCERQSRGLSKSFQEDSSERKSMLAMPKKCPSGKSVHYSDWFPWMTILIIY